MKALTLAFFVLLSSAASAEIWRCEVQDKNGNLLRKFEYNTFYVNSNTTFPVRGVEWTASSENGKLKLSAAEVDSDGIRPVRRQATAKIYDRNDDKLKIELLEVDQVAHCYSNDVRALIRSQEREDEDVNLDARGLNIPSAPEIRPGSAVTR